MPTVPEPTAGATNRPNYGLGGPDRFPSHTGKEWFGGNVQELTGAAPSKPNDRIHLTLIGPESARKSARSTLESDPSFAALATQMGERLAVQDYAPDHPMISGIALPFGGRPDVVIQDARGAVKYRAKDFPGPSVVVAELRKADPNYKPERDPNGGLGLGGLDTIKTEAEENPALCVVILCLLLVLLLRKKA